MSHARLQTLPPPGSKPARRTRAGLPYQLSMGGYYKIDRVYGSQTETIARKCGQCGDSMPVCGFAPVFEEAAVYKGKDTSRRVLLCWNCYMEY